MTSPPVLTVLASEAARDPLLEMFLLTAIDQYAQSVASLAEEDVTHRVLEKSPRHSKTGINPAAWKQRAQRVTEILAKDYEKDAEA